MRTHNLCVCGHKKKSHIGGKCTECNFACIFKAGDRKTVK